MPECNAQPLELHDQPTCCMSQSPECNDAQPLELCRTQRRAERRRRAKKGRRRHIAWPRGSHHDLDQTVTLQCSVLDGSAACNTQPGKTHDTHGALDNLSECGTMRLSEAVKHVVRVRACFFDIFQRCISVLCWKALAIAPQAAGILKVHLPVRPRATAPSAVVMACCGSTVSKA